MSEKIQKIGIGSAQFGIPYGISNSSGKTSPREVTKILALAQDKGVRLLDTASAYGNAEKVLGMNDLSCFKIVSKFMPPDERNTISDQLFKSLADLHVSSLYGYLAHRPKHLAQNLYLWDELIELKKAGKIQKIGFSVNCLAELKNLLNAKAVPDIIQAPFNYFDRRFENVLTDLEKEGCEIHARSAFLQGLFFMKIKDLDPYFTEIIPILADLQDKVENLPEALLKFVIEKPFINHVIIGVENKKQLSQNLNVEGVSTVLPNLHLEISENILIPSNWPI
jgi:aryl-alcohol dehydrogenase-like predicted oxidoreductase